MTDTPDDATAIMLASADARAFVQRTTPLISRIAFLRSWHQQTGVLGDVGQAALNQARRELFAALRETNHSQRSQPTSGFPD